MDFNMSFLTGLGCGVCISVSLFYAFQKYFESYTIKEKSFTTYTPDSEYRLVLIVRTDLSMGKGKIAAQCGHAAVGAIAKAQRKDPETLEMYKKTGETKVALKTDSVDEIKQLANTAKELGLITSLIRDAGRTQIAANSITVLAIGPAPKNVIDIVTGHLKLL